MNKAGIYRITLPTGAAYVGQSANIERRLYAHKFALSRGKHPNQVLQEHTRRFGLGGVTFDILEECAPDRDTLALREAHWIAILKPPLNVRPAAQSGLGMKRRAKADEYQIAGAVDSAREAIDRMRRSVDGMPTRKKITRSDIFRLTTE